MTKIIINADDFGVNPTVNAATENALKNGKITSATILANSDYWENIVGIYDSLKNLTSFGVHLNLTQGRCLTESKVFHNVGLVDDENNFTKRAKAISEWTEELLHDVFAEWKMQVETVMEPGICISHFDGHHHVHTIEALQPVLIELCKIYNIHRVRSPYIGPLRWKIANKMRCIAGYYNGNAGGGTGNDQKSVSARAVISNFRAKAQWRNEVKRNGIRLTDYFNSYESFYQQLSSGRRVHNGDIVELMCHPGHPDYEEEMELIMHDAINPFVKHLLLINYHEI